MSRISELNDKFRTTFQGGKVMLTNGVVNLPDHIQQSAVVNVRNFDGFTEDNDPYGEHDFGAFLVGNYSFFWKIDCYDKDCQYGSEDPSSPEATTRVLTVMLREEY